MFPSVRQPPFLVPFYHVISDEPVTHTEHLYRHKTVGQFRHDLDHLLSGYRPISLAEVLECRKAERTLPERSFLLTFDDGYREMSEIVAPILLEKGVSATFFLNSAFVDNKNLCHVNKASLLVSRLRSLGRPHLERRLLELIPGQKLRPEDLDGAILSVPYEQRALLDAMAEVLGVDFPGYLRERRPYLTSAQVAGLVSRGFTVGGHSIDHPFYASLSLEEQLRQTIESVRFVRERFGLTYGVFAFPFEDVGVSRPFFDELFRKGQIDLTFGAAGLIDEDIPNHLQRVCMEAYGATAKHILAYHHARRTMTMLSGRSRIKRTASG